MRLMTKEDLPAVHKLLVAYLDRFALHRLFTEEDVAVRLLPRGDFIKTYVVEDDSGVITDVASYYKLRSPVKKRQRKQVWGYTSFLPMIYLANYSTKLDAGLC